MKKSKPKRDEIDETIDDITTIISDFKNDDIFICLQDCLKKLQGIKKDHGH